eukprot:CCRYP_020648-RA/>CCRYP_020648-RA protein AED:0.79 eAED:0.49 QI:0/-1/0/1/-1/1/1/0/148
MSDEIPPSLLTEVYAIDELDRDKNPDFPLAMTLIKSEQDKDTKLQSLLKQDRYKSNFGILTFGDHEVHTFNTKVWVPPSLQRRIIEWYHTNLRHPGVTRTLNSIGQTFGWKGMRTHVGLREIMRRMSTPQDRRQTTIWNPTSHTGPQS